MKRSNCMITWINLSVFLGFALSNVAFGEVYRYKDEFGCTTFSDKPQSDENSNKERDLKRHKEGSAVAKQRDITEALTEKYKPKTALERATLAVVTIKTSLTSASGFFITGNA